MKRFLLAMALVLGLIAPAHALKMLLLPITTAIGTTSSGTYQFRGGPGGQETDTNMIIKCTFTYGSGGTSVDAYIQTSIDGGSTWMDVVHCSFTTSSLTNIYNLSSNTVHTTAVVPTDGALTANTSVDGIIGMMWRVKYVTVGTYAGGTVLNVDAGSNGLTSYP